MNASTLLNDLKSSEEFFERSTRCLTEEHSGFRPTDGMWTVSQQVAHAASTIEWFVEAASRTEGFDMDFEKHAAVLANVTSLTSSRQHLAKAYRSANDFVESKSEAELERPLPAGPIMGGEPVWQVFAAIVEHSAHHRGALSVYSRMAGMTPKMPYME